MTYPNKFSCLVRGVFLWDSHIEKNQLHSNIHLNILHFQYHIRLYLMALKDLILLELESKLFMLSYMYIVCICVI